jgi:hypothetical protein
VHRGVATALIEQQRSKTPTAVDLYEDATAMSVDLARRAGATLTEEEMSRGVNQTFGNLKDEAVRYARGYATEVGPAIVPIAVERQVTVRGLMPGIALKGTVDLIDQPEGQEEVIRDTKTTERTPPDSAADLSAQLTMYAMLRQAEHTTPQATKVSLDYLIRRKNGVESKRLESTRGEAHFAMLRRRIQAASAGLKAGTFLPSNPESDWWCSPKFCPYWQTCVYINH